MYKAFTPARPDANSSISIEGFMSLQMESRIPRQSDSEHRGAADCKNDGSGGHILRPATIADHRRQTN
jgi:hypothetical protein